MRCELRIPATDGRFVLFDPAAISELLAEDSRPRAAFARFPRKLDRERKRGNAIFLDELEEETIHCTLVEGEEIEVPAALAEREPLPLRVPSGRLQVAASVHPRERGAEEPSDEIGNVSPGLYRVRRHHPPVGVEAARYVEARLPEKDRRVIRTGRRARRWSTILTFVVIFLVFLLFHCLPRSLVTPAFLLILILGAGMIAVSFGSLWLRLRPRMREALRMLERKKREARSETGPLRLILRLERVGDLE